eukprot:tig00001331_g8176.t1
MGPKKKGKQPAKRARANDDEGSSSSAADASAVGPAGSSQLEQLESSVIQRILTHVGVHDAWKSARGVSKRIRAMLFANQWDRIALPSKSGSPLDVCLEIEAWTMRAKRGQVRVKSLLVQAPQLCPVRFSRSGMPDRGLVPDLLAAMPGLEHIAVRHGDISTSGYTDDFPPRPKERSIRERHMYATQLLKAAAASSATTLKFFEFWMDCDAMNAHDALAQTPSPTGRLEREFLAELRKLTALRHLNLAHYCNMEPEFVRSIAKAAPQLSGFNFSSSGDFQEEFSDDDHAIEEEVEGPALEAIVDAVLAGFPDLEELDIEWGGNAVKPPALEALGRLSKLRVLGLVCRGLAEGALAGLVRGLGPAPALHRLEIRELEGSISFEGQLEALESMTSLTHLEIDMESAEPDTWAALGRLSRLETLSLRTRVGGVGAEWASPAALPRLRTLTLATDGCAGTEQAGFYQRLAAQLEAQAGQPWGLAELNLQARTRPSRAAHAVRLPDVRGRDVGAGARRLPRPPPLPPAVRRALRRYERDALEPSACGAELAALAACTGALDVQLEARGGGPLKAADAAALAPLAGLEPRAGHQLGLRASEGAASDAVSRRLREGLPGWSLTIVPRRKAGGGPGMTPALMAMLAGMGLGPRQ